MIRYRIGHQTCYAYAEPVSVCHSEVYVTPRDLPHQRCLEFELQVLPTPNELGQRDDQFGNRAHWFSVEEPHQQLRITARSLVELAGEVSPPESTPAWDQLCSELWQDRSAPGLANYRLTFDSRRVQRSVALADYAAESFSAGRPVLQAVQDLTARIHGDFSYVPGATDVRTPVAEVFQRREGVCQDFAHLQIGCLRSLGLPARYVSGYLRTEPPPGQPRLRGADASHAWLSVFCGEAGWIDVDPTNDALVATDHVTLAWGRDYDDVCPARGVFVGGGDHTLDISVEVEPLDLDGSSRAPPERVD